MIGEEARRCLRVREHRCFQNTVFDPMGPMHMSRILLISKPVTAVPSTAKSLDPEVWHTCACYQYL